MNKMSLLDLLSVHLNYSRGTSVSNNNIHIAIYQLRHTFIISVTRWRWWSVTELIVTELRSKPFSGRKARVRVSQRTNGCVWEQLALIRFGINTKITK